MFKNIIKYFILLSMTLNARTVNLSEDINVTKIKESVKFAIELGGKNDFWTPGITGNIIDYKTEGLLLGSAKLKVKLYDSDVFTLEKYGTFGASNNQKELLEIHKNDRKKASSIDGFKVSIQLFKVVNYLFDKEYLDGFNYEFDRQNFIGESNVLQNSVYWYGRLNGAIRGEDYDIAESTDRLSFKTKFTSHRLFYKFENLLKSVEGSYVLVGAFDEEWSKPTVAGYTAFNGELPIIFDANYYAQGVMGAIGIEQPHYNIQTYFDYGLNNEMKAIKKGENYSSLNRDVDMYMIGLKVNYNFLDIYSKKNLFTTNATIGARVQATQITENSSINVDAETLYGINASIEVVF